MRTARVLFRIAWADFLERVRRYSFFLTLAGAAFLCYQVHLGNLGIHIGRMRGEMNSAWLGAVMTLVATTFLSYFGFYVVKNAVALDERTGVGQILAATPLSRTQYVFGKALSNFAVLALIVLLLAAVAPPLQRMAGEDTHFDFVALFAPFVFVALPAMAFIAALAVLFETVRWLRGGLGNILYLFFFNTLIVLSITTGFFDPAGLRIFAPSMQRAARAAEPGYKGEFGFGAGPQRPKRAFVWTGVEWTPLELATALIWPGISIGLCFASARCFNRFDVSPARGAAADEAEDTPDPAPARVRAAWTRLSPVARHPSFPFLCFNELRLMLKGRHWLWYAGTAGAIVLGAALPASGRGYALAFAWIWPVLLWSGMGGREARYGTSQLVFSAPYPVRRQLPAAWVAGLIVSLALGAGAAARLLAQADWPDLAAFLAGALLPPSLALCLGVWSGGSKAFEVAYTVVWYVGPLSRVPVLDFTFSTGNRPLAPVYAAISAGLLLLAAAGRKLGR